MKGTHLILPSPRANFVHSQGRLGGAATIDLEDVSLEPCAAGSVKHPASLSRKTILPSVSVVICTRHRPEDLRNCLQAISRLDPAPDEILVIDNSGGDPDTEGIACAYGTRYITEPISGLSRARNRGLVESCSEIVAYIDDDAVPCEDWLEQILAPFADPQVASVSGDVVASGNPRDPAPAPARTASNCDAQWFEMATFGGMGWGANMAVRKSACSVWSGFDVRLGKGAPLRIAEESHAFAMLLALGFRSAYVPAAVVYHPVKPWDPRQEAISSFAYWLLLLCEFPGHRLDLIRFLTRRLRGKRITWPRNPQTPGQIISSGWRFRLKAGFAGALLYIRSRKLRAK